MITCRHCGLKKPYVWLGGYHCDDKGILQPEVWWYGTGNPSSEHNQTLGRRLMANECC